jgi:hypothetical protein
MSIAGILVPTQTLHIQRSHVSVPAVAARRVPAAECQT